MTKQQEPIEALKDIRNMMERSSRFISLSGLSGVFVGAIALLGAWASYLFLDLKEPHEPYYNYARNTDGSYNVSFLKFFFLDSLLVLFLSVMVSSLLTVRKARKGGLSYWDHTAKHLLSSMLVPLLGGGLFCLIMVYQDMLAMVAPAMLVFYGLALVSASKYTYTDIFYLGLFEVGLGLLAAIFLAHGLLFWSLGFGVMHMVYGIFMYFKYERNAGQA